MYRIGFIAVFFFITAQTSSAQESSFRAAADAYLTPRAQDLVVIEDTVVRFRTELRPEGRVDLDHHILRAEYSVTARVTSGLAPEAAARSYLDQEAVKFGIPDPFEHLAVTSVRQGHRSSHVTFRQVYHGIPVYHREVKVNLNAEGQPTLVFNGFAPDVAAADIRTTPEIARADAIARVRAVGREHLDVTPPELVVYPSAVPRLAWLMRATPASALVEWEVLVDAHTGEIIQMLDLSLHAHRPASSGKYANDAGSAGSDRAPDGVPRAGSAPAAVESSLLSAEAVAIVDGTGLVFDPDPLTSAGVQYGPPYVDGLDADIPELNAERKLVTLRDISQGQDGLYRLEGPYVRIDNTCGQPYVVPAETSPDGFQYGRENDYFEAVNAYFHIDKSQRYIQSLDVGFDIRNEPTRVNPHGYGDNDDSQYSGNCIIFGTGGIDDAEDADVIWHEYGHALLDFTAPGLLSGGEGRALHEGWSDYWAASYSRFLSEEDPDSPPRDWWRLYTWDGNSGTFQGRSLDHSGHYPDNVRYTSDGVTYGNNYDKGVLWATTLMEIYSDIGRTVTDRLNLASHIYLASGLQFPDAAQAIIQADEDLYGGIHANVLIDRFGARGYVDPAAYGPILTHEPLEATEDLGVDVPVEVVAIGTSAPVDSVYIYYGTGAHPSSRIALENTGGDAYSGGLPLPSQPGDVHYYVEAVDTEGRRRRLPTGAPLETYVFTAGPDVEPPAIAHEAPLNVSVIGWPMDVYVEVSDNIGVDSVWVEYGIRDTDGVLVSEGFFGLTDVGDAHFGTFPPTAHKVQEGESISYRIFARDDSRGGNEAVSPSEGFYHVSVIEQGVLRAYDFEGLGQGLQGSGLWQRGMPGFGLRVAHSGEFVWATNPTEAYPEGAQVSSLLLPAVDLSEIGETYLIFWHWYDFEHDGQVRPGEFDPDAGIWDGGNVKVSADGGEWEVVQPDGGYNGTISAEHENPLGGELGFGGFSFGWRREIVQLPAASDVRVRFDFGTDDTNRDDAVYFGGWHIDDVSITTTYPQDDSPPVASALPDARIVLEPGQDDLPVVAVTVDDDTGIEAVVSEYSTTTEAGEETGSIRLAMSTTDRTIYSGEVAPPQTFAAGDRIEYRIVVRDFDGNEVRYPTEGEAYVVDYRSAQQLNALAAVVATGAWHQQGSTWVTTGASTSESVSSLVLKPFTPPANGESAVLVLEHRYEIDAPYGGNVKLSDDDAATWAVIAPEGGYPATLSADASHPMAGEGVFAGSPDGTALHTFDLSNYAGRSIRLRLDFASPEGADEGGTWFVQSASYEALTPDDEFETPYELRLHANFPDPFADQTTITYSVPDRTPVRVSVYDMLGRRVTVMRHVVQDEGIYTVQFGGSGLANGVYMLYLETSMGTRTERMVVAR